MTVCSDEDLEKRPCQCGRTRDPASARSSRVSGGATPAQGCAGAPNTRTRGRRPRRSGCAGWGQAAGPAPRPNAPGRDDIAQGDGTDPGEVAFAEIEASVTSTNFRLRQPRARFWMTASMPCRWRSRWRSRLSGRLMGRLMGRYGAAMRLPWLDRVLPRSSARNTRISDRVRLAPGTRRARRPPRLVRDRQVCRRSPAFGLAFPNDPHPVATVNASPDACTLIGCGSRDAPTRGTGHLTDDVSHKHECFRASADTGAPDGLFDLDADHDASGGGRGIALFCSGPVVATRFELRRRSWQRGSVSSPVAGAKGQSAARPALVSRKNWRKIGALAAPMPRALRPTDPGSMRGGINPRLS